MAPYPDQVGTGEQETIAALDSVARELSEIVGGASKEVGELQLKGLMNPFQNYEDVGLISFGKLIFLHQFS